MALCNYFFKTMEFNATERWKFIVRILTTPVCLSVLIRICKRIWNSFPRILMQGSMLASFLELKLLNLIYLLLLLLLLLLLIVIELMTQKFMIKNAWAQPLLNYRWKNIDQAKGIRSVFCYILLFLMGLFLHTILIMKDQHKKGP